MLPRLVLNFAARRWVLANRSRHTRTGALSLALLRRKRHCGLREILCALSD
jgi:hypothetical protein